MAIKNHLMTGLDTDYVWPIYDGVADTESYLAMKPRIMFVLKEPYDDSKIDERGRKVPYGGGWSFTDLLKKQSEAQQWPICTWQRVIYALYGYRNGMHYHEMDYIRNAPEMGNVLLDICWINLSKMPGLTSSSNKKWQDGFKNYWSGIFLEQINLYDPDVIVFAGTFEAASSYIMDDTNNGETIWSNDGRLSLTKYHHNGRLILAAAHPGIRHNVEFWVDSIIDALHDFHNKI